MRKCYFLHSTKELETKQLQRLILCRLLVVFDAGFGNFSEYSQRRLRLSGLRVQLLQMFIKCVQRSPFVERARYTFQMDNYELSNGIRGESYHSEAYHPDSPVSDMRSTSPLIHGHVKLEQSAQLLTHEPHPQEVMISPQESAVNPSTRTGNASGNSRSYQPVSGRETETNLDLIYLRSYMPKLYYTSSPAGNLCDPKFTASSLMETNNQRQTDSWCYQGPMPNPAWNTLDAHGDSDGSQQSTDVSSTPGSPEGIQTSDGLDVMLSAHTAIFMLTRAPPEAGNGWRTRLSLVL
ncbi:hypothetical protein HGRIS_010499 [Hohenbuehelia grisea]|uniref:Uncharacterized protein n=1 Tax=Hohenbuehelia grisea TaxID=104357 RepID=A0ABR3IX27_9AGAR